MNARKTFPNPTFKILFISDRNLGQKGLHLLQKYCVEITALTWNYGEPNKSECYRLIRSQNWDICISLHSDLILKSADLQRITVPLNIHPASPQFPGLGHDILPLTMNLNACGATLHFMNEYIDDGDIIDVVNCEISPQTTRSELRQLSQNLCLQLLTSILEDIAVFDSINDVKTYLNEKASRNGFAWHRNYHSKKAIATIYETIKQNNPNHRIFR